MNLFSHNLNAIADLSFVLGRFTLEKAQSFKGFEIRLGKHSFKILGNLSEETLTDAYIYFKAIQIYGNNETNNP